MHGFRGGGFRGADCRSLSARRYHEANPAMSPSRQSLKAERVENGLWHVLSRRGCIALILKRFLDCLTLIVTMQLCPKEASRPRAPFRSPTLTHAARQAGRLSAWPARTASPCSRSQVEPRGSHSKYCASFALQSLTHFRRLSRTISKKYFFQLYAPC